jgi:hypothetical protein
MISSVTLVALGAGIVALFTIAIINRFRRPDHETIEIDSPPEPLGQVGDRLGVLTWNIGYGALGKNAEFFMDGGRSMRPSSQGVITHAAHQIGTTLTQSQAHIACIQELAEAGFLTRGVNVRGIVDKALVHTQRFFWVDLKSVLFPRKFRFRHGMGNYASKRVEKQSILSLPDADTLFLGFIRKSYAGLMNTLPIKGSDKSWVVINIHLPVYGATAEARLVQLCHLFEVAQHEYERGNFVVIGGDWNMRLCDTDFLHATDLKNLSWVADVPHGGIPDGWQIAIDPTVPTVRSLLSAFKKGTTYTTIFDGFVVSPNVTVENVTTRDMDFAFADHQPVEGSFVAEHSC